MIPDEAVEAAARAFREGRRRGDLGDALMAALEAAAPHMLAGGWESGFQKGVEFSDWVGDLDSEKPDFTNPYRTNK